MKEEWRGFSSGRAAGSREANRPEATAALEIDTLCAATYLYN